MIILRGCGAVWLTFEVWDFATPVQIWAAPFFYIKTTKGSFKNPQSK